MAEYVGNQFLEYRGISVLTRHQRCPGSHASGYREHHPNETLTLSRRLRPRNYVSRYGVYHPSQTLTTAREPRFPIWGEPPPHSMLEEDYRYPRNALGTRTTTCWLPDTQEYLIALFKCLGTRGCSLQAYSVQNLQGRL